MRPAAKAGKSTPTAATAVHTAATAASPASDGAPAPQPARAASPDVALPEGWLAVDRVGLNIDYQIIRHFSEHLYGSANKAVEELVANGFDAYARRVYVYTPGRLAPQHVVVWDDGASMDVEGLHRLWWIARSPKAVGARVVDDPDPPANGGRRGARAVIGKFGIGKLASYALGDTITHVCRRGGDFLVVRIDYTRIEHELDAAPDAPEPADAAAGAAAEANGARSARLEEPIYAVSEPDARTFLGEVLAADAKAFDALFAREHWTVAVVGALKKELPAGRLRWVIGNGMPIRPDFTVWINDEAVAPAVEAGAVATWDIGTDKVRQALEREWADALKDESVDALAAGSADLAFGARVGLDAATPDRAVPFVQVPGLGEVWGTVRLFETSLLRGRAAEHGRSHGFFVMVRDRLLNPVDDKLLLAEPSFGTFYRSQFVVHADGLDDELLADRERLRRDGPRARAFAVVQRGLYRAARVELDVRDDEIAAQQGTLHVLPTRSREFFREPLTSLLMKMEPVEGAALDIGHPKITRAPGGAAEPLAALVPKDGGFNVNVSHPLYEALERRFGRGKKAQEMFRVLDLYAVAEPLMDGFLTDLGLPEPQIRRILGWRDGLFRQIAESYERASSDLISDLHNASYRGDREFERAIGAVLADLGFEVVTDGATGKKDGMLTAAIGPDGYRFTFEAKGSKNAIKNSRSGLGEAAGHRDAEKAEHAVIVAREFVGFAREGGADDEDGAAVLRDCAAVGAVSVMTVDALAALHDAVEQYPYPLDLLKDVFTAVESPADKLARIAALTRPEADFDYRGVLDAVWEQQRGAASGDFVSYRPIYQSRPEWRALGFDRFTGKLVALETLAPTHVRLNQSREYLYLKQAPERVMQELDRALQARASEAARHGE